MRNTIRRTWLAAVLCASAASAAGAGGTIEGTVNHRSPRWVRDTVVYLEHAAGDFKP